MGQPLGLQGDEEGSAGRGDGEPAGVPLRDCAGCVLAGECLDPKAKRGRTVHRDEHEPLREKMAAKMQRPAKARRSTTSGCTLRRRRLRIIKSMLGVRQFLLRGLEKVRTEWLWVCTAYNLKKLLAVIGKLRPGLASEAAEAAG